MQTQTFLQLIQQHYQFNRANKIFAKPELKYCWKHWLSTELIVSLDNIGEIEINAPYIAPENNDEDNAFLSFKNGDKKATTVEKRQASKCDFLITRDNKLSYVEVRCVQSEQLLQARELKKFTSDIERVSALKEANPNINILTLFAIYGQFQNKDMKKLASLDNSESTGYVLDTDMTGSGSIARFSHVRRDGSPRIMLFAHTAR